MRQSVAADASFFMMRSLGVNPRAAIRAVDCLCPAARPRFMAIRDAGQVLRIHHVGKARIAHHLRHDAIVVPARLVDDPREPHDLVLLELDALRKGRDLAHLHVTPI